VGPCITSAFETVYKAAVEYPKDVLHVSLSAFRTLNVCGPLAVGTAHLGAQVLGWKRTQLVYDAHLLNDDQTESAGHKYVPYMLATGTVTLIQTVTGLVSSSPYAEPTAGNPAYDAAVNQTVSIIMNGKPCMASECAIKVGETAFNCTLNFFVETFKNNVDFNAAAWINSDVANQLYQIGGVNLVASGLGFGFALVQFLNECKVTKRVNPFSCVALTGAAFYFIYGLIQIISTASIPYENQIHKSWDKCEQISG